MERIDGVALGMGFTITAVLAIPLAATAAIVGDEHPSVALWCNIGVLGAFVLGSGCAAWLQRRGLPVAHGIVTAGCTFGVITGAVIVVNVIRGEDIEWFREAFLATLVLGAGVLGGMLGSRLQAQGIHPRDRSRPEVR